MERAPIENPEFLQDQVLQENYDEEIAFQGPTLEGVVEADLAFQGRTLESLGNGQGVFGKIGEVASEHPRAAKGAMAAAGFLAVGALAKASAEQPAAAAETPTPIVKKAPEFYTEATAKNTGKVAIPRSVALKSAETAETSAAHSSARRHHNRNRHNKRRGWRPQRVMNSLRYAINRPFNSKLGFKPDMNLRRAVAANGSIELRGNCNPRNPYTPGTRVYRDTTTTSTIVSCFKFGDGTYTSKSEHYDVNFTAPINNIGKKVAKSAGVPVKKHGDVRKIVANRSRARVVYKKDPEANGTRQLKKLVLRKRGRPVKRWYR